jgi:hypothetical protein
MSDFLLSRHRPADPRELLAQISARYSDREQALRIFVAAVHDDRRYVRACIEHAFETWTSRAPQ